MGEGCIGVWEVAQRPSCHQSRKLKPAMRQEKRSSRWTTCWDELLVVR
ncbi:DUF4113 domain-containing protein [Crenobacter cavernae]|uniref:DUF4113 domain-containing protein n=1 Tax=Crenobacter cavernae TaxID=2290923 RepID=A0A345Y222_9NEIS|nr:DUF4113 domain-containing protein [Crenobacter cavernae]